MPKFTQIFLFCFLCGAMVGSLVACAVPNPTENAAAFARANAAYDAGDYANARQIWHKLGAQNDLAALYNLGHIYRRGLGVEADLPRAIDYYQQAAQYGFAPAQYNLAMYYFSAEQPKRGLYWVQQAAKSGFAPATDFLSNKPIQN